jgi:lipid-binding SYLF domain-containing protein
MKNVRLFQSSLVAIIAGVTLVAAVHHVRADEPNAKTKETISEAQDKIALFKKADSGLAKFFENAAGYVVFPEVGKGGFIVGGAGGKGILFKGEDAVGAAKISQVTVGAQAGGQKYAEVIFFENEAAVDAFKKSEFKLTAQASAVAATEGASANAKYTNGVVVFTMGEKGLMAEASVGGQKLKYVPFSKEK